MVARDRSGFLLASAEREVAAGGHLALFVDELFEPPVGFTGVLELRSLEAVVPISLKLTQNQRGDPILTTLPIADLTRPAESRERIVPQLAFGPGLSTRLILLSSLEKGPDTGEPGPLTGGLLFNQSDGTQMELALSGQVGGQFSFQVSRYGGQQLRPGDTATIDQIELLQCHSGFGCRLSMGNEATVHRGEQMLLLARVTDSNGEFRDDFELTYEVSPPIARVDAWGQTEGVEKGFADVEVSHGDLTQAHLLKVVTVESAPAGANLGVRGLAQDGGGRLYLASEARHTILRADDLESPPQVYAGTDENPGFQNGARLDSEFEEPAFVSYDHSQGRLYVSDSGNHRIRLVEPGATGEVQTLAGRGTAGHRDGPGLQAEFQRPQGLARVRGFLWVADSENHVIRKINLQSQVVQTVAGQAGNPGLQDGEGEEALFNTPSGLKLEMHPGSRPDPLSVIVVDTGNGVLRRVNENGQVETISVTARNGFGNSQQRRLARTVASPKFHSPIGVAVDPFGNLFVSEEQTGEVLTLLSNGTLVRAAAPGTFGEPAGLALGGSGKVLVADHQVSVVGLSYGRPEIQAIEGTVDLTGGMVTVRGRNFAPETGVVVAGVRMDEVTILDTQTLKLEVPPGLPSGRMLMTVANRGGLAQARLLIQPPDLDELQPGEITTVSGGRPFFEDGGVAEREPLRGPSALAIHPDGDVFFSDTEHQRIRRIDALTGVLSTVAGRGGLAETPLGTQIDDGGSAVTVFLSGPRGLALDVAGTLFFAEEGNNRIRKVDPLSGLIETVAGGGNSLPAETDPAGLGDGGLATDGELKGPRGVWVDGEGNLLIADTGNHRVRKVDQQGILSTVAGTGVAGFEGDGGRALEARLNAPSAVALDRGDLYIVDSLNDRIRKVDSAGTITTIVGPGVTEAPNSGFSFTTGGVLETPLGLWVDVEGRLLIADSGNHRVRRFDPFTGTVSTIAGTGVEGFSGQGLALERELAHPAGVTADGAGAIWIADTGNDRIRRVVSETISTRAGAAATDVGDGGPAIEAALGFPTDITLDSENNLYISDSSQHRVRRVDGATQQISTAAGTGEPGHSGDGQTADQARLSSPAGLALDADGNLFFSDTGNHNVRLVDGLTQIISTVIQGDPTSIFDPSFPRGIDFDAQRGVLLADSGNHRILSSDPLEQNLFVIAGTGEPGSDPQSGLASEVAFDTPYAVEVGPEGNVYIADSFNHRIRRIDAATGIVSTFAGNGTAGFSGDDGSATLAHLNFPTGLSVDDAGNVFIADTYNHRIRIVEAESGLIRSLAGGDAAGLSGDGGNALQSLLSFPSGVLLDRNGNLLIVDRNNHRIRAIKDALQLLTAGDERALSLLKTASPDPVNPGERLTYSLTLTNSGSGAIANIQLVDELPSGVDFVSASSSSGSCQNSGGPLNCNLDNIFAGEQVVVNILVDVKNSAAETVLTNSAVCSRNEGETDLCQASVSTRVRPADSADLAVMKQAPAEVIYPDPFTYLVTVTNQGPAPATGVTLMDTLPAGLLNLVSISSNRGSCSASGDEITCALGTLLKGAIATVQITVTPSESAEDQALINRVEVSSNERDFLLSDSTYLASTRILPRRQGLSLEKAVSAERADPGDTLVYDLHVTNHGPAAQTSVEFTDDLPPGVSLVSAIPEKGSCQAAAVNDHTRVVCSLGSLGVGERAGAAIEVTVKPSATNTFLVNSASCGSDEVDPDECRVEGVTTAIRTDDCAALSLSVEGPTSTTYSADDPEEIAYTAVVTNQGPEEALGVRLNYTLPIDPLTRITEARFRSAEVLGQSGGSGNALCAPVRGAGGLVDQVSCTLGDLEADSSATVQIVLTANAAIVGRVVSNRFQVEDGSDCGGVEDSVVEVPLAVRLADVEGPQSDLSFRKNARSQVRPGDSLTYSLTISNSGPTTASGVVVTDRLPSEVGLVSISPNQGECQQSLSGDNIEIVCAIGLLGNGQFVSNTAAIIVETRVDETVPIETTIMNEASCSSNETDPDGCHDAASTEVTGTVGTDADLSILKSASAESVSVGDSLIYTLDLINFGPDEATGVTVTDTLPEGVSFDSELSSPLCTEIESQVVECSLGVLGTGSSSEPFDTSVEIGVQVLTGAFGATLENTVTCNSDLVDPDGCEDSVEVIVSEAAADMSIVKQASTDSIAVGQQLTYIVEVLNSGPEVATGVVITDTLPAGVAFVSAQSSSTCGEVGSQMIECNVGTLGNGESPEPTAATFTIAVEVLEEATGTTLENTASCSSDLVDPDGCQDSASVSLAAGDLKDGEADLVIFKDVSEDPVTVGDQLTYTLDLINFGPDDATDIVVIDNLPEGLSFNSESSSQECSEVASQTIECSLDLLGNGESSAPTDVIFEIVAEVLLGAADSTLENIVTCTSGQEDFDGCEDSISVQVSPVESSGEADLVIFKDASDDPVSVGDQLTYTLELINFGPDEATGVVAIDNLPEGVRFESSLSSSACSEVNGQTIECEVGLLGNGDTSAPDDVILDIVVEVLPEAAASTLENNVTCTSDQSDFDGCEDSIEVEVLGGEADLQISKEASANPALVGGTLTYTVEVMNQGPNDATGVVVTDTLPNELRFNASASSPLCSESSSQTVECTLGNLEDHRSLTVSIVVDVLEAGAAVANLATCVSDVQDSNGCEDIETIEVTEPTPTETPTPEASPTVTGTPSTSTPTATSTATAASSTPTATPTPSTATPTATPTSSIPTPTPTATAASSTPTATPTPSTATPTATPTSSVPTPTPTATAASSTPTATPTPSTATPTVTPTSSIPTPTPTATAASSTPTATPTPSTATPTATPTSSVPTPTPTATAASSTPTATPTPSTATPTATPVSSTSTPAVSATPSATATVSSSTSTPTPTMGSSTSTPTATGTPAAPTLTPSPTATPSAATSTPSPTASPTPAATTTETPTPGAHVKRCVNRLRRLSPSTPG